MFIFADVSAAEGSIRSSAESLGRLFAIILALAIGESFKQFVADKPDDVNNRHIYWDRISALIAFVVLVVPFSHGMARYFFEEYYREAQRPQPYSLFLFIDTLVFTIEAILFFVLSRALPQNRWQTFYATVWILLALDIGWGSFTAYHHEPKLWKWVLVNLGALVLLSAFLFKIRSLLSARLSFRGNQDSRGLAMICMLILIARTVADYSVTWTYYFPPPEDQEAGLTAGGNVYLAGPGVFLQDSEAFGRMKLLICNKHGLKGHYPTDNQLPIDQLLKSKGPRGTVLEISANDELGMDQCKVVLADLTPCFSGLTDLRMLVKGKTWDKATLLRECPGLQVAFEYYPGLAELMIDFPESGQLLTGQPDTGTVFELGYMVGKGKGASGQKAINAIAYSNSPLDYYSRLLIANAGVLPKRIRGAAANFVEEDFNAMMVDRLDPSLHCNLMIDCSVIRLSGKDVHVPTIAETRGLLEEARRAGRKDGMYTYLGVFERAVRDAAAICRRAK